MQRRGVSSKFKSDKRVSATKPILSILKRKPKKRKKASKRKLLKNKIERTIKEYVRIRDKFTCQWCGKQVSGSNCHVSHVIPVSRTLRLAYDDLNLKVLDYHCHINVWHKNPMKASEWFQKTFPDRWAYLKEKERESVSMGTVTEDELNEWLGHAQELLKNIKEKHGSSENR